MLKFGYMFIDSWLWAQFHQLVSGALFFDLKPAFYMVLRQTLIDIPDNDKATFRALVKLGILLQVAAAQKDNATAGLSQHAARLLEDALSNTFFLMRGSQIPTKTNRGTRPGDALRHVLFNADTALILHDTERYIDDQHGATWVGNLQEVHDFQVTQPIACPAYVDISFVSDAVSALHGHSNDEVQELTTVIVDGVCKAAAKRGLLVNFDAGKIEMI